MAEYDLTAQLHQVVHEYADDVAEDIDKAADECTKGLKKELQSSSPQLTGKYAKTWTSKSDKDYTRGGKTHVVYNSKNYQLTHLLEKPHAGPYGRGMVEGTPHIEPAEKKWTEEFVRRCEEACKR